MGLTVAVELLLMLQGPAVATVVGSVRDGESGQPIANASVLLTDLNQTTATDAGGRYVLRNVPAGPQHITVRFIGYTPRTLDALVPREGQLEINVSLRPQPVRLPPIEVGTPGIHSLSDVDPQSYTDRSTSLRDVRNNPLLAEPDVFQAVSGAEVVMDPESPTGVHIRGGGSDQTAYLLDGIPVLSPYHVAGMFSAWNPDALAGLELSASSPSPALPETMSGTIAASTRKPGERQTLQGSISTSQGRATLDGPLGIAGANYLASFRVGFLPGFAPKRESSYLAREATDLLIKLEAPVLGGSARLLGYHSNNELNAHAGPSTDPAILRNDFAWASTSIGGGWKRPFSLGTFSLLGWSAESEAAARWNSLSGIMDLSAHRHDYGVLASVTLVSTKSSTLLGARLERSRTNYGVNSDSGPRLPRLAAHTLVGSILGQHARALGQRVQLVAGASLSATGGDFHLSPRGQVRYQATDQVTISGSVARLHQFWQSLRNAESVVGFVFPVDLYIGAGARGVPVARSDQAALGVDLTPLSGVRIGAQVYERRLHHLLVVAPGEAEPFSTRALKVGSASSRGLAIRASVNTRRYGLVASYGLQRVAIHYGDSSYVPSHGATHLLEAGVIVFPTATSSIRVGASGALGRRSTTFTGTLEWEACNLLDQGCEFGGSPHYGQDPLGGTSLPSYFRVDLSARKHWHIRIARREAMVAFFGTVTNLLRQRNVLTYARDPSTGAIMPIEMRPRGPLVVGVDWRF